MAKDERGKPVQEAARLLDLEQFLDRKPKALSGGQRQRVAMGRAIVRNPQVFCMDEPLSNLDAKLRVSTRTQIASLQQRLGVTTVYVTHDQVEAMTMGDRVAVLKDGLLQQVDTPLGLYDNPVNLFVAGFIGSPAMNLFEAELVDGGATVNGHKIPLAITASDRSQGNGHVTIGIRPESFRLSSDGEGIPVKVTVVEELGADAYVYGVADAHAATMPSMSDDDSEAKDDADRPEVVAAARAAEESPAAIGGGAAVVVRVEARREHQKGSTIHVTADPENVHVFSPSTGERLGR